jgi:hypothetical protein
MAKLKRNPPCQSFHSPKNYRLALEANKINRKYLKQKSRWIIENAIINRNWHFYFSSLIVATKNFFTSTGGDITITKTSTSREISMRHQYYPK